MDLEARILTLEDTEMLNDFYIKSGSGTRMNINLHLDRSPDFREAVSIHGFDNKVLAVIDRDRGQIATACIVSLRHSYIRGSACTTGYMCGMKSRSEYAGTLAFARFMKLFNEYWQENMAVCWIFSSFADNQVLNNLMHRKHQLFPEVKVLSRYVTHLFKPAVIPYADPDHGTISCRYAQPEDAIALGNFLKIAYPKKEFSQADHIDEIWSGKGEMKGYKLTDIALAFRDGKIVGTAGLWDQSSYRRWYVEGYSCGYSLGRPLINLLSRVRKMPGLPAPGQLIPYRLISTLFIENDDPGIFLKLLNCLKKKLNGNEILSLGLPEHHPFANLVERKSFRLENNIYLAYKNSETERMREIQANHLYLEQGSL
ncbi:MAG: hypothetical protein JW801_15000 [Bacteroidales bacterium]|nr:hypothetical protein [Bacteroidales bacterium]